MVASESFFQRKQAAAVLKHGILSRYPTVFATMAGTNYPKVVYFDGYAGPGQYEDGSPGSPMLAVATARRTATWGRKVQCLFCEQNFDHFVDLEAMLAKEAGQDLTYEAWYGDVSKWTNAALTEAASVPMLTLLDPFGNNLRYSVLTEQLLARPRELPTEVILNFNVESVQRTAGYLTSTKKIPGSEATLSKLDEFFGGSWWRARFLEARTQDSASAAAATQALAKEFCLRVSQATGFGSFPVPIRRRATHPPLFLMVLFFRHPVAPWKFNGAVSMANREWRRACLQEDLEREAAKLAEAPDGLWELDTEELQKRRVQAWEQQEVELEASWTKLIAENIAATLATRSEIRVRDSVATVYGNTLGLARDMHVTRAWDSLTASGVTQKRPAGSRLEKLFIKRQD